MQGKRLAVPALLIMPLICAFGTPRWMHAQDDKTPYPRMAPLEQYLQFVQRARYPLPRRLFIPTHGQTDRTQVALFKKSQ